jgi:hypothetical protein
MASLALASAALVLAAAAEPDPVFQVEYSNPGLSPSHWTLALHPDGSGRFHSERGSDATAPVRTMETPNLDREIQLSPAYAAHVFLSAHRHKLFAVDCDSHSKMAFQGWKTLSYSGPEGQGACNFNYSKDKEIQALGESLLAVAQTILEGARLEMLLEHDRLGLDKETEFLVEAAGDGRAEQLGVIREILERLAADETVMDRVRKRARQLLAARN